MPYRYTTELLRKRFHLISIRIYCQQILFFLAHNVYNCTPRRGVKIIILVPWTAFFRIMKTRGIMLRKRYIELRVLKCGKYYIKRAFSRDIFPPFPKWHPALKLKAAQWLSLLPIGTKNPRPRNCIVTYTFCRERLSRPQYHKKYTHTHTPIRFRRSFNRARIEIGLSQDGVNREECGFRW